MSTVNARAAGFVPLPDDEIWDAPERLSAREGREAAGGDWRWRRAETLDAENEE